MTIYLTLTFFLLMAEMAVFMLLIIPFPFSVRRKIFTFLSENPIVAKIQYGLKITFIFILMLFVDSVNRVYRVQVELAATADNASNGAAILGRERLEVQARKFYSQRNMYLCGFTLFLSLILNRTFTFINEILHLEEKLQTYEGPSNGKNTSSKVAAKLAGATGTPASSSSTTTAAGSSAASGSGADADLVYKLRQEITRKDQDLATLKKQAEGLQKEYKELSDKYEATQTTGSKKLN